MEEQLDIDDSDILRLLHSVPLNPVPGNLPLVDEFTIEEQLDIDDSDICPIVRASSPKAALPPLPGSSRPSENQENSASSIFSRLQRPRMQFDTQEQSQDVVCRVYDPLRDRSFAVSASVDVHLNFSRKRNRIEGTDDCIEVFPFQSLTTETLGVSGANFRPRVGSFKVPSTNSQAGRENSGPTISSNGDIDSTGSREEPRRGDTSHVPGNTNDDRGRNFAEPHGGSALSSQGPSNIASLPYRIPGPAGSIQMAFRQKNNHPVEASTSKPKQNALRRGAESRVSAVDDMDFKGRPWLAAMDYLRQHNGCELTSTISSIKSFRTENRIRKLVTIIKTCAPNGCGDVLMTLKDHSGIIGGIINRNVMTETEFGRNIEPGAVILLHKVAVFSPVPYAHYLNITMNNVEQVFKKEFKPSEGHGKGPVK